MKQRANLGIQQALEEPTDSEPDEAMEREADRLIDERIAQHDSSKREVKS